jgi:hypothetical protein
VQGNVEILKPNFPTKLIFYCTVFLLIIFWINNKKQILFGYLRQNFWLK